MSKLLDERTEFICCHNLRFHVVPRRQSPLRLQGHPALTRDTLLGASVRSAVDAGSCGVVENPPYVVKCRRIIAILAGINPTATVEGDPFLTSSARGLTDGIGPGVTWGVASVSPHIASLVVRRPGAPPVGPDGRGDDARQPARELVIELTTSDGRPVPGELVRVLHEGALVAETHLDGEGVARVPLDVESDRLEVTFPGMRASDWKSA